MSISNKAPFNCIVVNARGRARAPAHWGDRCADVAVAWSRRRIHVTKGSVNSGVAAALDTLLAIRAHTVGPSSRPSRLVHPPGRRKLPTAGECWPLRPLTSDSLDFVSIVASWMFV